MKILVAAALIASTSLASANCSITTFRTGAVTAALKAEKWDGWDLKKYDVICNKLAKANARLIITGQATVLHNLSIGWASVRLGDMNSAITTIGYAPSVTMTHKDASVNKANALLIQSMQEAVDGSLEEMDEAIVELNAARAAVRKQ